MHLYVHCSIIHGGQDKETTELSFARGLDKEDMLHVYNEILLSHKKRWNTVIWDNMSGPWKYHAKWNNLVRKSQEPYNFTYM